MGGKSTYIRSVALTVLLAQIGSFVPCDSAKISLVDYFFTRIGVCDNPSKAMSTFMYEMLEIKNLLKNASQSSLLIIDEMGRETSTFDGCVIEGMSWAMSRYIAETVKAACLFATHFHDITSLSNTLPSIGHFHFGFLDSNVTFLHRVQQGVFNESFGVHLEELAGSPTMVIENAEKDLKASDMFRYLSEIFPKVPSGNGNARTGAFLDKPKTEKHSEFGCGNGLSYGLSSMQGWRIEMEDAHCALVGLPQGLTDWSFFAVFDGHAGARVSVHCAENLLNTIIAEDLHNNTNSKTQLSPEDIEKVKKGIRSGFLKLDERMKKIPEIASGEDKSGSTAVCCLISSTHFYFANCGDSRSVLSRDKKALFSTEDHKPINPAEKERIQKAGGSVMIQRVNGSLAVSRALGDYEYKQVEGKGPCEQLVSPEPQVDVLERNNDTDEFLVLACDGVWDVMTNDEICDHIRYLMQTSDDLEYICNCVIDACLCKGSKDNMSIVLVALPGAPKVSEEVVQQDKEINKLLEERVKEIITEADKMEMCDIMRILAEDVNVHSSLMRLPLGALFFKHSFLEEVCNKVKNSSSTKEDKQNSVQKEAVQQN